MSFGTYGGSTTEPLTEAQLLALLGSRIRALAAQNWTWEEIAVQYGITPAQAFTLATDAN